MYKTNTQHLAQNNAKYSKIFQEYLEKNNILFIS